MFGWDIHVDIVIQSVAEAYITIAIENDCFMDTTMLDLLDALPPDNSPSALIDHYMNDWWNDPELVPFTDHIPASVHSRLLNDATAKAYLAFHNEQRAAMSMPEPGWELPPTKTTYTWSRLSLPLAGQVDDCRKCLGYRSVALSSFDELMTIKTHIDGVKVIHEKHFNRSLCHAGAFHELFVAGLCKEEEVPATTPTAMLPEPMSIVARVQFQSPVYSESPVPPPEHFQEAASAELKRWQAAPEVQWTYGVNLTTADLPRVFGYAPEPSDIHSHYETSLSRGLSLSVVSDAMSCPTTAVFSELSPSIKSVPSLPSHRFPVGFMFPPLGADRTLRSQGLPGLSHPSKAGAANANGGDGATTQRAAMASLSAPSGATQTPHNASVSPPTNTRTSPRPNITPAVNLVNASSAGLEAGDTAAPMQGLPCDPDEIAPDVIDFSDGETDSKHGSNGRSEDNDPNDNMPDIVDFSDGEADEEEGSHGTSQNMRNPSFGQLETASSPTSNQDLARDLEDIVPDVIDFSDGDMALDGPTSGDVNPELIEVSTDSDVNPDFIELSDDDESPRLALTEPGPHALDVIDLSSSGGEEGRELGDNDNTNSLDPDLVDFSDGQSSEGQHDYSAARFDPDMVHFSDGEMEVDSVRHPYVPPVGPYTAAAFANIDRSMLHLNDNE